MQLLQIATVAPPEEPSEASCKPEAVDFWLPSQGTWLWWLQHRLVVLCEDMGAKVFADARKWLQSEAGESIELSEKEEDDCFGLIKKVMPDILSFPTLFKHGQHEVIGLGREIEHRRRAAHLGFAALRASEPLLPKRRAVAEQVRAAGWFPSSRLERFYDLEQCWLNMETWRKGYDYEEPVGEAIAKAALKDVRMNCQCALLLDLKRKGGYAFIDLTESGYPWPKIIAGHLESGRIVGEGVKKFLIVADSSQCRDAHQDCELVHFVVDTLDGARHRFDDLKRTHESKWELKSEKDETEAFRIASKWAVKGRWEAFAPNVFQNLIRDFKASVRPDGWGDSDWRRPVDSNEPHAPSIE